MACSVLIDRPIGYYVAGEEEEFRRYQKQLAQAPKKKIKTIDIADMARCQNIKAIGDLGWTD